MKNTHRILAVLIASGISVSALAAVTASVDRNNVASGETVRLLLQRDGSADSQPDLGPLKKDFDVLGSSSGSNIQIVNGHMSSQTQVNVLLAPKHDGKLQIPPLQWDGQQSAALELTVGGSGNTSQQGAKAASDSSHVFLTATLDQKQPYVQAAVVLTVRLYTDQPLIQASLDLPASSDVLVKPLGKDTQSNETRNGRNYQIVERKYLLFPQRSGKLSLEGPVLDAQVQDTGSNDPFGNDPFLGNIFKQMPLAGMMNATRPLRLHGKPIELNVLPRPASVTGANWLPAQKVTLEESWRPDGQAVHVGEPLTRHLHIAALGLTGAQLPDLSTLMSVPDGIKAYPDQSSAKDSPQGDTVLGSRDQDIALMATRPGHYELPAVRLNWWDTLHNTRREVMLPAHTLDILSAAAGTAGVTLTPPANTAASILPNVDAQASTLEQPSKKINVTLWQWFSIGLGLLWLGTMLAWWYSRKRVPQTSAGEIVADKKQDDVHAASAFKAFRQACRDDDPHAARKHLLAWAATAWPVQPPLGLNELARRLDDDDLAQSLRQLDRACYTGDAWQGQSLGGLLAAPPGLKISAGKKNALPELYH